MSALNNLSKKNAKDIEDVYQKNLDDLFNPIANENQDFNLTHYLNQRNCNRNNALKNSNQLKQIEDTITCLISNDNDLNNKYDSCESFLMLYSD